MILCGEGDVVFLLKEEELGLKVSGFVLEAGNQLF